MEILLVFEECGIACHLVIGVPRPVVGRAFEVPNRHVSSVFGHTVDIAESPGGEVRGFLQRG